MVNNRFFRQKALESYQQNQIPQVMPRFIPLGGILLYWTLFLLCIGAALAAWAYNTPRFEQGTGVMRLVPASSLSSYGLAGDGQQTRAIAILLLPAQLRSQLHAGDTAQIQVKGTHHLLSGHVEHIDETMLTQHEARQRFALTEQTVAAIPPSAFVAFIGFGPATVSAGDNGRSVTAHIQTGEQNVLSLFSQTEWP